MVVGGSEIRKLLGERDPRKRLVISPILNLEEQIREDQASIDLRLGFHFAICRPSTIGAIDELLDSGTSVNLQAVSSMFGHEFVPFGEKIVLHPQKFLLGCTLEYVRVPENHMAYVIGRSSWGRLGLVVATAIGVHPGFSGAITLELRNLGETPVVLYPGQAIAQLFIHKVEGTTGTGRGQYVGEADILPKRLSSNASLEKLRSLAGVTSAASRSIAWSVEDICS
jgi:dCTP deaminase